MIPIGHNSIESVDFGYYSALVRSNEQVPAELHLLDFAELKANHWNTKTPIRIKVL